MGEKLTLKKLHLQQEENRLYYKIILLKVTCFRLICMYIHGVKITKCALAQHSNRSLSQEASVAFSANERINGLKIDQ